MRLEIISSTGQEKLETRIQEVVFQEDMGEENHVINLYPEITYQNLEGFGGAITDAAGYVYSEMNKEQQEQVVRMYFGRENMNYQMVRVHADSCDFSTHLYSAVEDEWDENLESFSFADTERHILPLLDAAQKAAGKKLKIMLTAWSPPPFMKTNGERKHGGSLKREFRERWADYLCRYIREFRDRGYEVVRMSVQNEPKAVQTWDSCVYTAREEKEFLRDYLYPALKKWGLKDVEIFIWDHNKERAFERARDILDHQTDRMVTGVAFHWYSGDHFEALDLIRQRYPDKKLILSESCLEFCKYGIAEAGENAGKLAHDMIGNLNHGMSAFYDWNILLDGEGGPNHVGNFCDAPYLFHEDTKVLEERRILRYYWHFAHFIRPGAVRMAYTGYTDSLDVTAWKNPDGENVVILLNKTDKTLPGVLRINQMAAGFEMKPGAILSCVIKGEKQP